ncbi:MAG: ATP-dependent Clp protease proteolytic subunit, partial [Clostridium sp.]
NAYVLKTGLSEETLLDLMNKETFMNAQKAKELGFVDEIMFDTSNRLINNTNESGMLQPDVIEKIRNMKDEINLDHKANTTKVDENLKENEINKLKEKLAFKNKYVSSFLLCQKERVL